MWCCALSTSFQLLCKGNHAQSILPQIGNKRLWGENKRKWKGRQPPGVKPMTPLAWAASVLPPSHDSRTTNPLIELYENYPARYLDMHVHKLHCNIWWCCGHLHHAGTFLAWWRWPQHHWNVAIKFVNNLIRACPNIELGVTTTATMTLKLCMRIVGVLIEWKYINLQTSVKLAVVFFPLFSILCLLV